MLKRNKITKVVRNGWNGLQWSAYESEWNIEEYISESDANKILAFISKISDKKPQMKKGCNILIDRHSDLPRPKLKEFISDNGYKKVTLMDKADIIAIRRETVDYVKKLGLRVVLKLSDADNRRISSGKHELYLYHYDNESNMDQEYFDVKGRCTPLKGMFISGYRNKKLNEQIDFLFSLINSKKTIVFDDVLMNELNNDGLDLDNDIYETLEGMLKSKDRDTFNLGIEMLSNVNLENNLFDIARLLNDTFNTTHNLNALSQIKNKNFKALLNYVESQGIRWNQKWESFGMSMYKRFKDSPSHKADIKEYLVKCINTHFKNIYSGDAELVIGIVFEGE
jgi:hypothetical protein